MNNTQSNPTTTPVTAEAVSDSDIIIPMTVIKLPFRGDMVYKQDIRKFCGLKTNFRWTQHINFCRAHIRGFEKKYMPWIRANSVPKKIALHIIKKSYDEQPYQVEFIPDWH